MGKRCYHLIAIVRSSLRYFALFYICIFRIHSINRCMLIRFFLTRSQWTNRILRRRRFRSCYCSASGCSGSRSVTGGCTSAVRSQVCRYAIGFSITNLISNRNIPARAGLDHRVQRMNRIHRVSGIIGILDYLNIIPCNNLKLHGIQCSVQLAAVDGISRILTDFTGAYIGQRTGLNFTGYRAGFLLLFRNITDADCTDYIITNTCKIFGIQFQFPNFYIVFTRILISTQFVSFGRTTQCH